MTDLAVIFRTQSDVEASIVRGLLESHGVPTVVSSALPHSVFPLSVNTLGEVMDGDWYVNRHAAHHMSVAELQRGPGHDRPPDMTAPWRVLVVKPFGVNPGLLIADGCGGGQGSAPPRSRFGPVLVIAAQRQDPLDLAHDHVAGQEQRGQEDVGVLQVGSGCPGDEARSPS